MSAALLLRRRCGASGMAPCAQRVDQYMQQHVFVSTSPRSMAAYFSNDCVALPGVAKFFKVGHQLGCNRLRACQAAGVAAKYFKVGYQSIAPR